MKKLLIKAFVSPFYKAFFGFFIVVFIVMGLLMEAPQHVKIGVKILQHPTAFATLLLGFLSYGWLQYRYHIQLIQDLKYRIFHQLALFNSSDFTRLQLSIWAYNHLLLLLYALFLTFLAIQNGFWIQLLLLWLLLGGMCFTHKRLLFSLLSQASPDQKHSLLKKYALKLIPIKRAYWLIVHIKENRPLLLLASKAFQIILLQLFFYSYTNDTYDERWLQFGLLCVAFVNIPIWLEKKEFEQKKLAFFLNLPRPFLHKAWLHCYSTLQILAPELLYLTIQIPNLPDIAQAFSLVFLVITLNLGLVALINWTKEVVDLPRQTVLSFFLLFFMIIYSFPALLISWILLTIFMVFIRSDYIQ